MDSWSGLGESSARKGHKDFATGRWWERFGALLPPELYAVAPDLRGCGASEQSAAGYDIAEQSADLRGLANALGWGGCHVLAHASSGTIPPSARP